MNAIVRTERQGDILVARFSNPPVNAISHAVREAFADLLQEIESDSAFGGLVICCEGASFFTGADIREFGKPPQSPTLPELVKRLIAARKPVVAAIHGQALGGGLELAMACQGRVVAESARLGLPEVKLGLLPGAGGTQILARLVNPALAVDMIAGGEPIPATAALEAGIADALFAGSDGIPAALEVIRTLANSGWQQTSARPVRPGLDDAVEAYRERHARRLRSQDAPAAIFAVLSRSAGMDFEAGMAIERAAFERLRDGTQSKALRHLFAAERAAGRLPELDGVVPRRIESVAVIGGGTMGSGIAAAALLAGYAVTMIERDAEGLDRGKRSIESILNSRSQADRIADLTLSLEWEDLARIDLIIEAAFEDMAVKQEIFARLGGIARPGAMLATNTSYLDVDAIADASGRPQDVVGLHFFSPAHIMKLLEIVRGKATAPDCLAGALEFARKLGKTAVVAGNAYGFIGNRMLAVRKREAEALLLQCRSPAIIDTALEGFGFAMGPFKVSDLAGLDLGWSEGKADPAQLRDRLCLAGRKGRKTSAGYYDYDHSGKPRASGEADAIIAAFAEDRGVPYQVPSDEEIILRLLLPMIAEAERILGEGIARSEGDIDVVWVNGYGWPRWTGGPMYWKSCLS